MEKDKTYSFDIYEDNSIKAVPIIWENETRVNSTNIKISDAEVKTLQMFMR